MTPALVLLALPFAGLLVGGFRSPLIWPLGACWLWGAAWALRKKADARPLLVWLPWLGWALLSALASGQPAVSLPWLSRWAAAAAFLALAPQVWEDKHRRWWLTALFTSSLVLAAAALFTGVKAFFQDGLGTGFTGLLPPHYNYTAYVQAAAFAAAAARLIHARPEPSERRRLWVVLAVSSALIVLARARGAFAAAVCGAVLAGWRAPDRRRLAGPLLALALAVLAVTGLAMARGSSAGFLLKPEKAAAFKRPQIWRAAVSALAQRPLWGEGPGQFQKGFRRHLFAAGLGRSRYGHGTEHAHSEAVEIAAETGVIGFALFLWAAWRQRGTVEDEAALAAAAAMAALCLVDNVLQLPSLALLLASALACAWPRPAREAAKTSEKTWAVAAAAGAAVALLAFVFVAADRAWSSEAGTPPLRLDRARRWAALKPREPGPREALARALQAQSPPRWGEALAQLEEASRLAPFNAVYYVWEAELLRPAGDWPRVEALAGRALELEPDFLQARLLLAEADLRAGRRAQAKARLEETRALAARLPSAPGGYDSFIYGFDGGRFAVLVKEAGQGRP